MESEHPANLNSDVLACITTKSLPMITSLIQAGHKPRILPNEPRDSECIPHDFPRMSAVQVLISFHYYAKNNQLHEMCHSYM
jgi:hypothetical protein